MFVARNRSLRLIVGHLHVESQNKSVLFKLSPWHTDAAECKEDDNDSPILFDVMDDLTSGHFSAHICCNPGIVPVHWIRWLSRDLWIGFVQLT